MGAFLMPWGRQQLANVEKWSGTTTTRPADSDTSDAFPWGAGHGTLR